MPVFKSGMSLAPPWCEVESFDIVHLNVGQTHAYERIGQKEKLFIGKGRCTIEYSGGMFDAQEGDVFDISLPTDQFNVTDVFCDTTLIRLCGRWGELTGSCGTFALDNNKSPYNEGDITIYPRTTRFDNHYHDCDEYWIIFEGRALAVSEQRSYVVGPGDCVATGMGHHHDLPRVFEPIKGVYFETTLQGKLRLGHLWDRRHGVAQPKPERV